MCVRQVVMNVQTSCAITKTEQPLKDKVILLEQEDTERKLYMTPSAQFNYEASEMTSLPKRATQSWCEMHQT